MNTMRWFVTRVLVVALPVLEILLLVWVGGTIGWGWTFALLLAGLGLGLALMRVAGVNAFRAIAEPIRNRQPVVEIDPLTGARQTVEPNPQPSPEEIQQAGSQLRRSGWLFVAGLLFALPGFLSDLAGLLLALPPVRGWLAARTPARPTGRSTVIVGETVGTNTRTGAASAAAPEPVIRGEILPPRP